VYAFEKVKVGVGNAKKVMLPSLHSQSYSYLTLEPRVSVLTSKLQAYGIYSIRSLGHMKWHCVQRNSHFVPNLSTTSLKCTTTKQESKIQNELVHSYIWSRYFQLFLPPLISTNALTSATLSLLASVNLLHVSCALDYVYQTDDRSC